MFEDNKITYFAETDYRNQRTKFGIKAKDRAKHMYIIGKTGVGKSTLLENLAIQDIQNDEGIIFIDPHGSSAVKLLDYIPKHRIDDVIYFAPHDTDFPIAFNPLEQVPKEKRTGIAGGIVGTLKKIWPDSFSSRMEYILMYTLLALLEVPGTTFLGINRMLGDKVYRKYILDRVEDSLIKNFWYNEFERYTATYVSEATAPIQNKVGQFIASPMLRNIIGQDVSTIDFRAAMDQKKILIINISKGIIGSENMRLLGGMLITKIQIAAMSRANLDEEALKRIPPTYLYVDEFQNFANESFAEILSESRKYKLCLTVANQYIDQMTEEVRNAVIGNVGTFISFRVGSTDALVMEREFAPQFTEEDMVNLGFAQIYLKLMIDGMGSRAFSATTLPPIPRPDKSYVKDILGYSRKNFSKTREEVDELIKKWTNKDYHLENIKYTEEQKNKNKSPGTGSVNVIPASGAGVYLNEMSGYDLLLQKEAEKLKQDNNQQERIEKTTSPTPPSKSNSSNSDRKSDRNDRGEKKDNSRRTDQPKPKKRDREEFNSIIDDLMNNYDYEDLPQKELVKSGEIFGDEEITVVKKASSLKKRDTQPRKKVLNDLQADFNKKQSKTDSRRVIPKSTKIPNSSNKDFDDEIPEDVLRALLDL